MCTITSTFQFILSYLIIFAVISIFLIKITTGKVIVLIYRYEQRNCPYFPPNITFLIQKYSDTSIQTQQNSASDSSMGAHDLASAGLYQSTNHHINTDVKYNDYSR